MDVRASSDPAVLVCPRCHHGDLGTNVLHPRHGQQFLPRDGHDCVLVRGRGGPLLGMGMVRGILNHTIRCTAQYDYHDAACATALHLNLP